MDISEVFEFVLDSTSTEPGDGRRGDAFDWKEKTQMCFSEKSFAQKPKFSEISMKLKQCSW